MAKGFLTSYYWHSLVLAGVFIVIIGGIFVMAWQTISMPLFDQRYAIGLLSRHDPNISKIELEYILGDEGPATMKFEWKRDSDIIIGGREVWIYNYLLESNGIKHNITKYAELSAIGSKALDIGPLNSSWLCPYNTWLNVSIERNPNYLYLGTTGTWPNVIILRDWMAERGGIVGKGFEPFNITSTLDNGTDVTTEITFEMLMNATAKDISSQIWYFNPNERDEFENMIDDMWRDLAECRQIL